MKFYRGQIVQVCYLDDEAVSLFRESVNGRLAEVENCASDVVHVKMLENGIRYAFDRKNLFPTNKVIWRTIDDK